MFYKTVIPSSRTVLGDLWLLAAVAEVELRATETEKCKPPSVLACCFLMEGDLLVGSPWGWLGAPVGTFPAPFLPVSRIKLTFDDIQVAIKARGTELRAFMWLKALLCFSQDDAVSKSTLVAWLRME